MHRAHRRDAVNQQKFWFRKDLYSPAPGHGCDFKPSTNGALNGLPTHANGFARGVNGDVPPSPTCSSHSATPRPASPSGEKLKFGPVEDEYAEFTINEIINGSEEKNFPGLMGVVRKYLDSLSVDPKTRAELEKTLELIRRRADGTFRACRPR